VVEAGEQLFAGDQRRRRVPGQARGEHVVGGVHVVVVVADDLRLDERIGWQLALLGILKELVGGVKVRGKPAA
jgi:hypothetical protein